MAKNNNLKDFLTDIANAIREKKGITSAINPQDFSSEIASIESGGGAVVSASISDVNFYDYDGTILYSYTKDQFLALSSMPELTTREGLICQGWNWALDEAKEYVVDYGMLNIGAMYTTDDGDTRLYIRIANEGRMNMTVRFSQTIANGVNIDWGDGSTIESFSGTGYKSVTHTYAEPGDYIIRFQVENGTIGLGGSSLYYTMLGNSSNLMMYSVRLQKVEIGDKVTSIHGGAFSYCYNLASVSIPNCVTSIGTDAFLRCQSLTSVNIPNSITNIDNYAFSSCYSLTSASIPKGVTSIGNYAFNYCHSLKSASIPNSVTSIGNSVFTTCSSLAAVNIPNGVTSIGTSMFTGCFSLVFANIPNSITSISNGMFSNCYSLISVSIPNSITSIDANTFNSCYGMAIYDFTSHTSVPTLANTNAFNNIPSDCKIKVPASLLEEWKAATNWSTYADKIVGV